MLRLEADRLIDGAGDAPRAPGIVCAAGERVASCGAEPAASQGVGGGSAQNAGVLRLVLPGCTLLPGLIDFHSHAGIDTKRWDLGAQIRVPPEEYSARALGRLQEDLRAGVTTLRLCGDRHGADLRLRAAAAEGEAVLPRLFVAGRAIRSPRCHGGVVAAVSTDDPEEIARQVAANLRDGADLVKLFISDGVGDPRRDPVTCYYGEAHVAAASRLAHAAGRPVAAHLLGGPGVAAAVGGGVDVIEHAWFFTDEDLDLAAHNDVLITLTMGVLCGPRGHAFGADPAGLARLRTLGERARETARKVIARGMRYVLGTDAVHGCLADEIRWAVALGEAPMRALQAATAWPAAALGRAEDLGTLEPGKIADVVAVEGDPLQSLDALDRVRLVVSRGRIVYAAGTA